MFSTESHSAMVILLELALYPTTGMTEQVIVQRNDIAPAPLHKAVETLVEHGYLTCRTQTDEQRLFLLKDPLFIKVTDILLLFDKNMLPENFSVRNNGKKGHNSDIVRLIDTERQHVERYLKTRYRKLIIGRWINTLRDPI